MRLPPNRGTPPAGRRRQCRRPAFDGAGHRTARGPLDEALAIAAALAVAPVHLLVPFEKPEVLNEDVAEAGIFEAEANLKIGDGVVLSPLVVRAWIRGTAIPGGYDTPMDEWYRFYAVEVPPPTRHRLRRQAEYVRSVPGLTTPENREGLPAPLGTMLMFEPRPEA